MVKGFHIHSYICFTVATVNFEEETYCVTKNDRQVQPALTLSNPSSININVTVKVWTTFGEIAIYSYYTYLQL